MIRIELENLKKIECGCLHMYKEKLTLDNLMENQNKFYGFSDILNILYIHELLSCYEFNLNIFSD